MSDARTNTPKIRFRGFTEDWEQRKLNEVSDIYDGTHQTPKYQDEGVMFLSVENIKTLISNKFISHEAFKSEFRIRPQRGDVLITRIGDVGTANVVETDENLAYYVSLALLKSEKLQPYFLQASIHAPFVHKQIWKRTLHIAFPKKINKNEIGQVPINIPTTDEQDKIGTFFKQLDDTIALHQCELDLLKQTKQTYLQKMFPKSGENKPEIRFAGFTEDWEQRKLNEVSDIYDGTHQTPKYQDEGVMFLSVENIKTLISNKFISHEAFKSEFRIRPQRGDVLITRIGDVGTANVVETDENLAYYVSLALLKSEKLQPYFLQASIHAPFVHKQIWKRTLHIAFPKKINKNEIGQVPINIPTTDEQDKIGTFFKQLDDTIALHQRKLDSLKEMKKSLLQQMFV
ncbi:restriction endonuclease subunit S [Enterococcus gallinarum]|uniref:restriction endonuclease subunit S n=1 Tax=Enterococcus gallinarum TaxID=1353 RepID=UPI00243350C7|nr:restriction endonuclease subunit S [Enterococcus gallinarum]